MVFRADLKACFSPGVGDGRGRKRKRERRAEREGRMKMKMRMRMMYLNKRILKKERKNICFLSKWH